MLKVLGDFPERKRAPTVRLLCLLLLAAAYREDFERNWPSIARNFSLGTAGTLIPLMPATFN